MSAARRIRRAEPKTVVWNWCDLGGRIMAGRAESWERPPKRRLKRAWFTSSYPAGKPDFRGPALRCLRETVQRIYSSARVEFVEVPAP